MLRLFRMYRFCAVVKKEIIDQNKDEDIKAFLEELNSDTFYVNRETCLKRYNPWLTRHKEHLREEIYRSSVENKYILRNKNNNQEITLNYKHKGGADLTEGYGWGFIRELLTQEWKLISLVFLVLGYVVGKAS